MNAWRNRTPGIKRKATISITAGRVAFPKIPDVFLPETGIPLNSEALQNSLYTVSPSVSSGIH